MPVGPTTRRRQLGADLRRLRERKGLTLEEAGAQVGISKATLSRYETKEGTVKWPAVDALCREYGASDPNPQVVRGMRQLIQRQVHFAGEKIEVPTPNR
ncbi:helix-turn-helix transcriptional regulator, partial [Streptomyces sp. NPDC047515]|uniref:helix-turn-helix domain-containing protein n=1 Tax=Streptomyces sp. NPDC047515 TaxID=3155380 RepID=UPI0034086FDE